MIRQFQFCLYQLGRRKRCILNDHVTSYYNRNDDINAQIEKEQQRIDNAYERIKPAIEEQ